MRWSVAMLPLTATGTLNSLGHLAGWLWNVSPHYRVVPLSVVRWSTYVHQVSTPEAETIDELIADCADLPRALRTAPGNAVPAPRAAGWTVSEACVEQVSDLDDYV
jgi:hypothetical protein